MSSKTSIYRSKVKMIGIYISTGYDKPFCTECGVILDIKEIEFHHIYPTEKLGNPSDILRSHGKKAYLNEIVKCKPVCRECHLNIHYKR